METIIGLAFFFPPTLLLYICVIAASRRINQRVKIYFVYLGIQFGSLLLTWVVLSTLAFGLAVSGGTYEWFFLIISLLQIVIPILVVVTFITRLPKVDKNEENISKKISKISPTSIYEKIWQ